MILPPRTACATRRGRFPIRRQVKFIETQFAQIPFLYIADGHHRSAAAARVFQSRKGAGHSGQFLAVIFPHNQMQILPYNRVLKDLNGWTPEQLLEKLGDGFRHQCRTGTAAPTRKHELGFYLAGQWHTLTFRQKLLRGARRPIEHARRDAAAKTRARADLRH